MNTDFPTQIHIWLLSHFENPDGPVQGCMQRL